MGNKRATSELGSFWFEGDIKSITLKNSFFRRVIYTGPHSQLALMSIDPDGETGQKNAQTLTESCLSLEEDVNRS
jgi:hypothetical protein